MTIGRIKASSPPKRAKLVYEPETDHARARLATQVRRIQVPLQAQALGPSYAHSTGALDAGEYKPGAIGLNMLGYAAEVKSGQGSAQNPPSTPSTGGGAWAGAIDLTDLTTASQGNPVLYSYFGAIREQIQRTANGRVWFPKEIADAGIIYVGFILDRSGAVQSVGVVYERSASSAVLQDAALRILQASSPFLPFPPSFQESAMAMVVPIEFALGF